MESRVIIADSSDELDEALDKHISQGWRVVSATRQSDGSYRAELEKDNE